MRYAILAIAAILVLAGCGTGARMQAPRGAQPEETRPSQPRGPAPRPDPASPAVRGKSFPECDPRARDADRVRVGVGLLAGDCADEAGRNAVYVTRFATVQGGASPSQRAGLQVGDRIVRIDACEVRSTHDIAMQLRSALPGWVARVYIERGGRALDIFVPTVTLRGKADAPPAAQLSTAGCKAIGRKPAT
jgi:hypothetical protein